MKTALFAAAAALCLAGGLAGAAQAAITPAVEFTSSSILSDSEAFTLGYRFDLSSAVTLDALGYYDDGLGNNHQVGIWDAQGNLVVSTTVRGSDSVVGHFRWDAIADTILAAGRYTIGGEYLGNDDPFVWKALGVTSVPQYSWVGDEQILGAGLQRPTINTAGAYGQNGILVVDLSVKASSAVPEPASWALMLVGFGGLGAMLRQRRRAVLAA